MNRKPQITKVKECARDGLGWILDDFDVCTESLRLEFMFQMIRLSQCNF